MEKAMNGRPHLWGHCPAINVWDALKLTIETSCASSRFAVALCYNRALGPKVPEKAMEYVSPYGVYHVGGYEGHHRCSDNTCRKSTIGAREYKGLRPKWLTVFKC